MKVLFINPRNYGSCKFNVPLRKLVQELLQEIHLTERRLAPVFAAKSTHYHCKNDKKDKFTAFLTRLFRGQNSCCFAPWSW